MKVQAAIPDEALIEQARALISKLCSTGGRSWSLRVPPDPERDPDMVFSELARRVEQYKQQAVFFAAEYAYKKANPDSKMNTPSIVYEDAERAFRKWIEEKQK